MRFRFRHGAENGSESFLRIIARQGNMIEGPTLTYANQPSVLMTWRPVENNLNTLLVSVVSTILVSQLFSIVNSLLFGCKRRNEVSKCDLYAQLVAWRSSPRAVSEAISVVQDGQYSPPTLSQAMKLMTLVGAAPLFNSILVALSIEREQVFTFKTAGFGGIALGLRLNNSVFKTTPLSSGCEQVPLHAPYGSDQKSEAKFVLCQTRTYLPESLSDNLLQLKVLQVSGYPGFHVFVSTWAGTVYGTKMGGVLSSLKTEHVKSLSLLRDVSSKGQLREWGFVGLRLAKKRCGGDFEAFETDYLDLPPTVKIENYIVLRAVCARKNVREIRKLMGDMLNKMLAQVSFVNAEKSLVYAKQVPIEMLGVLSGQPIENETRPLDDDVLFRRRAPIASVGVLLVAVLVVVVFRKILHLFVVNDVPDAIGTVIRHGMQLPCADSMLAVDEICVEH